ncbi:MAG: hypothetical protein EOP51_07365 [Sphingobacteriales bacterium]|nr:MAG: hypothetical protein EOP51_07365 [Sphingobacteriales bacterium]
MFNKYSKKALVLSLFASALLFDASARPNVGNKGGIGGQLKTTAGCRTAEGSIDLDINNVRARLMTGGDMWWDNGTGEARYEVPVGSRKNSLFAGSIWIGGFDVQGQLKVAAQTYRQTGNDYWPGPLDASANIQASECSDWDRFWKINKETINRFRELGDKTAALNESDYQVIKEWPAKGNTNAIGRSLNPLNIPQDKDYAPFVDVDKNGVYSPIGGDYPGVDENTPLPGDQYIWWVFNDKGNVKGESQTEGIGIEVQASAFAFSAKDALNDATFYNYKIINRGGLTLDSAFVATWTDADLGYYMDDFIGCDTARGLGILYNGDSKDGEGEPNSYGTVIPMVGVDFFQGPRKTFRPAGATKDTTIELKMEAFTYYNNDFTIIGNPENGVHIYNYMTGSIKNGEPFTYDFVGPATPSKGYGSGPRVKYVFSGDADPSAEEWSECTCGNAPADRRFIHSAGPFKLDPGVVNDIVIGVVWVSDVGGCPNTSFKKIRAADDVAQALFNNAFKTIEGPEAPRMVSREMDRKVVFYLMNDPSSTNFEEKFGTDTAAKYRVSAINSKSFEPTDSLYKFEGYRVFQLRDGLVQPAQILNDNGEVNNDLAIEVFQTDVKNNIKRIINYDKVPDISDTTYTPVVKVSGKDSGIRHSFEISVDQFAKTADKRLVNYRNYYFVAIAYAHNEFAAFDPRHADSTQDLVYLESAHSAGGAPLEVVTVMPNPANGDMGTAINADYGDGVTIKRIEGRGNGGLSLSLTKESEDNALNSSTGYYDAQPTYKPGNGPVDIKVIDPQKIQPGDWELYVDGNLQNAGDTLNNSVSSRGLDFASTWKLVNTTSNQTIYSERNIGTANEQILEAYGLSVKVAQVVRPGDDQVNGNGYIGSNVKYLDPAQAWLSGLKDGENREANNWIRSGNHQEGGADTFDCLFSDSPYDTVGQFYEKLLDNNSATTATWAPYTMGFQDNQISCGISTIFSGSRRGLANLPSVDVVFTSDKSKWTRCPVVETQQSVNLAENDAKKLNIRKHAGWNLDVDNAGRPIYSGNAEDNGMSWFPGYAINLETGERLNIVFGEDSYLKNANGADMIWNPTSDGIITDENTGLSTQVIGGKHFVYVSNTRYDQGANLKRQLASGDNNVIREAYLTMIYTGIPYLNAGFQLKSLADGLIPTETRLEFRIQRPYAFFNPGVALRNNAAPLYTFSTKDIAPQKLSDNPNADKQALLDRIQAVPNPYYGYTGYEVNNLDTRVRIVNLPKKATVNIYSLDGALIQRLEKDNANAAYIDWNVRNSKGLPIAGGMYLIHVKAEGVGETVIRWFGAMRPLNVIQY